MKSLPRTLTVAFLASTFLGICGNASADQPNMQEAIQHLRAAKASLERADNNKGGWRVAALEGVQKAIRETERGIQFARKH